MVDEQEQKRTLTPKSIWKELSYIEIGSIIVFIGYLIYLHNSTAFIKNFNDGNETRIINGVANLPQTVLYPPNSFVPKAPVSNTQTFFGIVLFGIVCIILLAKRASQLKRATMKEAMEDLDMQIHQLKNLKLSDGRTIPITDKIKIGITPQFMTRYRFITSQERTPEFRYSFLVTVYDQLEQIPYYFRAWYHPWTRFWDGFYETKTPLQDKDRCHYCGGTEYDTVYILGDDVTKFRELRKGLGFGGR